MPIDLLSIGVQTALIGATLAAFLAVIRFRMTKWVSLGFARMWKDLNEKAAEAEGAGSSPPSASSGTVKLGGFEISPQMIQMGMQLAEWAKKMGFLKGTGGGGGTFKP